MGKRESTLLLLSLLVLSVSVASFTCWHRWQQTDVLPADRFECEAYICEGNYIYTATEHILNVYYVEPSTKLIYMEAMYSEGVNEEGENVYWVQHGEDIEIISEEEFRDVYEEYTR